MRLRFFTLFLITLTLAGTYWYTATAYVCPVPLAYRLGTLDTDFNLTEEEARAYIEQGASVWEQAADRDLFYYDDNADFTINFTFDERQARANSEARSSATLDQRRNENEQLLTTIGKLQADYEGLLENYNQAAAAYEERLEQYNQTVQRYNDQGGAPQSEFEALQAQQRELNEEASSLQNRASELNELAGQLNDLQSESNQRVEAYNREVRTFNNRYGHAHEFTQGDYQGGSINIYKFSSEAELVTVLAHEFGHALGIGHVEDESGVMYYLLTEESETPLLTEADQTELIDVCGTSEGWQHTIRRAIRNALAAIT